MSIVREREEGTLEQLLITPLRPLELMIGKIVPYICVGYVQITIATLIGVIFSTFRLKEALFLLYLLSTHFHDSLPCPGHFYFHYRSKPDAGNAAVVFS